MNLNINNLVIRNSTIVKSNAFKAIIIGILLITTTFLVTSNTYGTAFAQKGKNVGCANKIDVNISHFPNQTAYISTQVALSNIGPNDDQGTASISIPGVGSGQLHVKYHIDSNQNAYLATISNFPGQFGIGSPRYFISKRHLFWDRTCEYTYTRTWSGDLDVHKVN